MVKRRTFQIIVQQGQLFNPSSASPRWHRPHFLQRYPVAYSFQGIRCYHSSTLVASSSNETSSLLSGSAKARASIARQDQAWFDLDTTSNTDNKAKDSSLFFKCTACGKCCTGKGGKVWVNSAERAEMADLLSLSPADLIDSYLVPESPQNSPSNAKGDSINKPNDGYSIRQIPETAATPSTRSLAKNTQVQQSSSSPAPDNERCIFLAPDNKCRIYQARPTQCRTFPYWPHAMASKYDWERTQAQCEGIRLPDTDSFMAKERGGAVDTMDPISTSTIWYNLLVHTVHRQGIHESSEGDDASSMTYTQMMGSLPFFLDEATLKDFQQDYWEQHRREIVYETQDLFVVDTLGSAWQSPPLINNDDKPESSDAQGQRHFQPTRSLIFRNSPSLTQSEMVLVPAGIAAGGGKVSDEPSPYNWQVDPTVLMLDVHEIMAQIIEAWNRQLVSSMPISISTNPQHFAVLGTGAGALPLYLQDKYSQAIIDCVEASAEVLQVARDYFGFIHTEGTMTNCGKLGGELPSSNTSTLRSFCQRGEDYLLQSAEGGNASKKDLLHLLVIDVADGVEVPPRHFFDADLLPIMQKCLVEPHGIVIWNVRASLSFEELEAEVLASIRDFFPNVHAHAVASSTNASSNSINWVVYASNAESFLSCPLL